MHPCLSVSSCAHSPGSTAGLQPGLSSLGRWRHGAAGLPFHRLPSCGLPGWLPEVTSSFLPGDGLTGRLWEEQDPFTLGGVGNTLFGSLVTNEPLGLPFGGACLCLPALPRGSSMILLQHKHLGQLFWEK